MATTLEEQLFGQLGSLNTDNDLVSNSQGSPHETTGPGALTQPLLEDMESNMSVMATIEPTMVNENSIVENTAYMSSYSDLDLAANFTFDDCLASPSTSVSTTSIMRGSSHTLLTPACGMNESHSSDLMRANLDEVYFEQVHAMLPMIHKRQYFSWAGQEHVPPARECLRLAMRTTAAAVSRAPSNLSKILYIDTRRILDTLDLLEPAVVQLEHIQAGILVAHYELMQRRERQAMLTAGRALRLIQISRLYDVDGTSTLTTLVSPTMADDSSFSEAEERRRTFWVAFVLDRFLSTRNEWPMTLQEETICTRLPAPETNFQNNQPIHMSVLAEAVTSSGQTTLSPFAECIVLAALVWSRVEWLTVILKKRAERLSQASPVPSDLLERDPMSNHSCLMHWKVPLHISWHVQKIQISQGPLESQKTR
ncbi:hypothetical protein VP1G_07454 [Cytospora mali]|uniref:Xylanolytic transcriptional activator regulatory domain-containing protein n=1 Tax=Cytospora mali TaxID=578113 RepID=A0A194V8N2_CYTMA|nr:hypothetical protein VP1G_07454 [Valsa mali var. pyri (nom. inval.)]